MSRVRMTGVAFSIFFIMIGINAVDWSIALTAHAQLNENCTISILNRTAKVQPNGDWRIDNVPARPGRVRARATCVENGILRRGQSSFFVVEEGERTGFNAQIPLDILSPIPASVTLSASTTSLTTIDQTVQLITTANLSDGSTTDATSAATGTNYTVSNTAIATVSLDGLVTAVASGTVLVSAINEGALGLIQILVSFSGQDSDGDGIPDDIELASGLDPNNPLDGLEDTDNDGLTNKEELVDFGTDFQVADTRWRRPGRWPRNDPGHKSDQS